MVTPLESAATATTVELPAEQSDRLDFYRQAIIQLLTEQRPLSPRYGKFAQQLVMDKEHDHYLLVCLGWNHDETRREYHVVLHFDISNSKIWLQHNDTELAVAQILVERGVPREDIVLGTLSTFSRQHSGYGVQ